MQVVVRNGVTADRPVKVVGVVGCIEMQQV